MIDFVKIKKNLPGIRTLRTKWLQVEVISRRHSCLRIRLLLLVMNKDLTPSSRPCRHKKDTKVVQINLICSPLLSLPSPGRDGVHGRVKEVQLERNSVRLDLYKSSQGSPVQEI